MLRDVKLTTGLGARAAMSVVMRQWSDRQSVLSTLTLLTSLALLVASTSSKLATSGRRRVSSSTSCVRPSDSKHPISSVSCDPNLHHFDTDQECDEQTDEWMDGRTDGQTPGRWLRCEKHYMLSHVKMQWKKTNLWVLQQSYVSCCI